MNSKLILAIVSIVIEGALAAMKLIKELGPEKGRRSFHERRKSRKRRNLKRL